MLCLAVGAGSPLHFDRLEPLFQAGNVLFNRLVLLIHVGCKKARLGDPDTTNRAMMSTSLLMHKIRNLRERQCSSLFKKGHILSKWGGLRWEFLQVFGLLGTVMQHRTAFPIVMRHERRPSSKLMSTHTACWHATHTVFEVILRSGAHDLFMAMLLLSSARRMNRSMMMFEHGRVLKSSMANFTSDRRLLSVAKDLRRLLQIRRKRGVHQSGPTSGNSSRVRKKQVCTGLVNTLANAIIDLQQWVHNAVLAQNLYIGMACDVGVVTHNHTELSHNSGPEFGSTFSTEPYAGKTISGSSQANAVVETQTQAHRQRAVFQGLGEPVESYPRLLQPILKAQGFVVFVGEKHA